MIRLVVRNKAQNGLKMSRHRADHAPRQAGRSDHGRSKVAQPSGACESTVDGLRFAGSGASRADRHDAGSAGIRRIGQGCNDERRI
jgi:hypothetical protein